VNRKGKGLKHRTSREKEAGSSPPSKKKLKEGGTVLQEKTNQKTVRRRRIGLRKKIKTGRKVEKFKRGEKKESKGGGAGEKESDFVLCVHARQREEKKTAKRKKIVKC